MKQEKIDKLFKAARKEIAPSPADGFESRVVRSIRLEPVPSTVTLLDQLNLLFPKLAWVSVVFIAICVAGDFLSTSSQIPTLSDGMEQLSEQWLFSGNGI